MDIVKNANGEALEVVLKGRLDTTTAPELEAALELDGITDLVLDFEGLEYISSAGLRVILAAQKKMSAQGKMVRISGRQPARALK